MKKLTYLFALVFFACSTEPAKEVVNDNETSLLKEITVLQNENQHFNVAEYSKHDLEVGVTDDNLILVNKRNGNYGSFYVIQFKEGTLNNELKRLKSGTFEVADLKGEVVISNGANNYYFSTRQKPQHQDLFKSSQISPVIGIAEIFIDSEIPRTNNGDIDYGELKKQVTCKCVGISGWDKCDSGGEGSTYCSVTGCSVHCGERYFACCND